MFIILDDKYINLDNVAFFSKPEAGVVTRVSEDGRTYVTTTFEKDAPFCDVTTVNFVGGASININWEYQRVIRQVRDACTNVGEI